MLVERIHLAIEKRCQALQDQNAHHHLGGIGGPPTLATITTLDEGIDQGCQFGEIDVLGNHLQRVTPFVDLAFARGVGK